MQTTLLSVTTTVTETVVASEPTPASPTQSSRSNVQPILPAPPVQNEEAVLVMPDFKIPASLPTSSSPLASTSTSSANVGKPTNVFHPDGSTASEQVLAADPGLIPIVVGEPTHIASSLPVEGPSRIMVVYYPDYAADSLAPESLDFDRIDWVDFAFGIPDAQNGTLKFAQDDSKQLLDRVVSAAHAKGKHVKLSIGGWTDSGSFSPIMASDNLRQTFVSNILAEYKQHNLDGIDIDWEYPGEAGNNNPQLPSDTANFLTFLQLLRNALPPAAKISAAVQDFPFASSTGQPIIDASEFSKVLDWVLLMNYDAWSGASVGPGGGTGSNAPLNNTCGNSTQPTTNAQAALKSWTSANFPASKLLLGVPSYGYVARSSSNALLARGRYDINFRRQTIVTGPQAVVLRADTDGSIQFNELITQGALVKNTTSGLYDGAGGFSREWDRCSSTPYLYSLAASQIVSYDDPHSVLEKASFVRKEGLLGINMFDAHGDSAKWELIDAARKGMGLNKV